jgi:tRNA1Val (adenine37-N6)-methyltransferase
MRSSRFRGVDLRPGECVDDFMEGVLKLIQSRDGYRFSIDAVLLSEFVTIKPAEVVFDLGTGCGVMLLLLLLKRPVSRVYGMEIQEELASQAVRNAALNRFEEKMEVILGDIRTPPITPGCAHVVICNPPYRRVESGRINPDRRRAVAKHELLTSLDDILRTASWLLKPKGRLALVYPAERLTDLLTRMRQTGLEPKRLQLIYPTLSSGAVLALVEGLSGGRAGMKIEPPLFGQGDFSICSDPKRNAKDDRT